MYCGAVQRQPTVIDAEFKLIKAPGQIRWWPVFWWVFYVAGCATAAYQSEDRGERIVFVVAAALIVPTGRLASSLAEKVSAQEAQLLRQRLLGRRVTGRARTPAQPEA